MAENNGAGACVERRAENQAGVDAADAVLSANGRDSAGPLSREHFCVILHEIVTERTMSKPLTPADLPEDLARFAEARIAAGLSANVEEALRAGAAALEAQQHRRDAKLAKLRAAIVEGDRSPDAPDGVFERIRERHGLTQPPR